MRAGEPLPRAQFEEHGLHILEEQRIHSSSGFAELFADERVAHLVVAEDGSVVSLGGSSNSMRSS